MDWIMRMHPKKIAKYAIKYARQTAFVFITQKIVRKIRTKITIENV